MSELPSDHLERLIRARLALEGLSVGDAFAPHANISFALGEPARRALPPGPWKYTDDTEMASAVYEALRDHGRIDSERLAEAFVQRYFKARGRGYSEATQGVLLAINRGVPWPEATRLPNGGLGSSGNGGAMRVAPVGAYFAEAGSSDFGRVVAEATASCEITHGHPDGIAGAVAVAVASAWAAQVGEGQADLPPLLETAIEWTPDGEVRRALRAANGLPPGATATEAASRVGSGARACESVPFALWCAATRCTTFVRAQWEALAGDGDRDTNCAIAGAVVALCHGAVPRRWVALREPLAIDDI